MRESNILLSIYIIHKNHNLKVYLQIHLIYLFLYQVYHWSLAYRPRRGNCPTSLFPYTLNLHVEFDAYSMANLRPPSTSPENN